MVPKLTEKINSLDDDTRKMYQIHLTEWAQKELKKLESDGTT